MKKKIQELTLFEMIKCCEKIKDCNDCPIHPFRIDSGSCSIRYAWIVSRDKEIEVEE